MSAKDLIKTFAWEYKQKIGEKYPPSWGRDMTIFTSLLKDYTEEQLKRWLHLYFEQDEHIYSVVFFKCHLSELIQLEKNATIGPVHRMPDNEQWRDL